MKQSRMADTILTEIEKEAVTTRKLLELIPEDKLTWRPHPKAMSLGQLALHIAGLQGGVAQLGAQDSVEAPDFSPQPEAASLSEILNAFEAAQTTAKEIVGSTDDAGVMAEWKLTRNGATIVAMPRMAFWRSILLNHNYHHRGQLSTYLRTLDVVLPSIYGPSADENPFG
jgi:uncharacterized damage-inducible protein DinB